MTRARRITPGCYTVTRRCMQRQFLLRPDPETNNAIVYCLGLAAQRYDVTVMATCVESNHHHTPIHDRHGVTPEFARYFHSLLARCQNVLRGRSDSLWSSEQVSYVELVDTSAVIDKIVYAVTNPVKDGLVDKVHHWPGVNALAALLSGEPLRAKRPWYFFLEDGELPDEVELKFSIPEELGDVPSILAEIRARVTKFEADMAAVRHRTGKRVLGRRAILRQSWRDCPRSVEQRRKISPRVATRNDMERMDALERNKTFLAEYRDARLRWLAGDPIPFPVGTYWLRRYANVPIVGASPPVPIDATLLAS